MEALSCGYFTINWALCMCIFLYWYKDFVLSVCGPDSNTSIEETEAQNGSMVFPSQKWLSWVLHSSLLSPTRGFPPLEHSIAWPLLISCLYWFIIKWSLSSSLIIFYPSVGYPIRQVFLTLHLRRLGGPYSSVSGAWCQCHTIESDAKPILAKREFRSHLL